MQLAIIPRNFGYSYTVVKKNYVVKGKDSGTTIYRDNDTHETMRLWYLLHFEYLTEADVVMG